MSMRVTRTAATIGATLFLSAMAARAQGYHVAKYNIGGDGGTDYLTAEPGTGRVFVSRGTHVMVIDGASGKVIGDIPDTPRTHGIALASELASRLHHERRRLDRDDVRSQTLAVIKKIKVPSGGLDGIMYDEADKRVILTNHSHPIGTVTAIDPADGSIVGQAELEDDGPEGAASDGKGWIYVNNEGKSTIQVVDVKSMKAIKSWPLAPCDGPTGIAYDKEHDRVISGLRKNFRGARWHDWQDRRDDRERRWRRRARMGRVAEAHLHPRRSRQHRHRGASGLARQVHRRRDGPDDARREDDRGRSREARGVSLPARVRASAGECTAGCARPSSAWAGGRKLVLRDHALSPQQHQNVK